MLNASIDKLTQATDIAAVSLDSLRCMRTEDSISSYQIPGNMAHHRNSTTPFSRVTIQARNLQIRFGMCAGQG